MPAVPFRGLQSAGLIAGLALIAAACGGSTVPGEAQGRSGLSDPASVSTATPSDGGLVFRIGQDGISAPGTDATITVVPGETVGGAATTYTVVAGDSCGAIAANFGVSVGDLLAVNPLVNSGCTNLVVDQDLRIPAQSVASGSTGSTGGASNTYVIVSGDTCGSIADAHAVSLASLLSANGMAEDDCTALSIGQIVTIPGE